jgi:hypothetical protein
MIKHAKILARFEEAQIKSERINYKQALQLIEAMWKEAMLLNAISLKDPLYGIEADIRMAKILNSNV